MSCLRRFSKALLVVCNLIFVLAGAILLGGSLYLRLDTHWSAVFQSPQYGFSVVYFFVGLGVAILLISLLGMIAAIRESKCLLITYLLTVSVALVLQICGAVYFLAGAAAFGSSVDGMHAKNMTGFRKDIMDVVKDQTTSIWRNGGCKIDIKKLPEPASCTNSDVQWLAQMVNKKCVPAGVTKDDTTKTVFLKALTGEIQLDIEQVTQCIQHNKGSHDSAMFCACEKQISEELQAIAKPVAITLAVVAGVEVLLFVCACYLMCCFSRCGTDHRDKDAGASKASRRRAGLLEAGHHYSEGMQPVVAQQGIAMV